MPEKNLNDRDSMKGKKSYKFIGDFEVPEEINELRWTNEDVSDYYENMPVAVLCDYAVRGGLESGCDVDLAYPYIEHANSLIDAGSAYGRVVGCLFNKGYKGKIYAVERSKNFCEHLKKTYQRKIEIIQANIKNFNPQEKVDAILWMWSGVGDFAKDEQLSILKHISSWLKSDGVLVLETLFYMLEPTNATSNEGKIFIINADHGIFYGYKPSVQEMQEYGEQLGFKYIKHIHYKTDTQRDRIIHVFSRRPI